MDDLNNEKSGLYPVEEEDTNLPVVDYTQMTLTPTDDIKKLSEELRHRKEMCVHLFNRCYALFSRGFCEICIWKEDCKRERTYKGGKADV